MSAKQRRNERQRQLNAQLSALPKFRPVNDHQVYLINHSTPTLLVQTFDWLGQTNDDIHHRHRAGLLFSSACTHPDRVCSGDIGGDTRRDMPLASPSIGLGLVDSITLQSDLSSGQVDFGVG